jgi:hypothetical protein
VRSKRATSLLPKLPPLAAWFSVKLVLGGFVIRSKRLLCRSMVRSSIHFGNTVGSLVLALRVEHELQGRRKQTFLELKLLRSCRTKAFH